VEETLANAIEQMNKHPYGMTSVRRVATSSEVSKSTVHRMFHKLHLKAYKPKQVQTLYPQDFETRMNFATRALQELDLNSVLWSDEAIFNMNGNGKSLRGSIWFDKKPTVLVEKEL
jgi:hypothetical protein